jgi:hypothetical protein
MSIPTNKKLYDKIKKEADEIYKKSSAYKSGFIQKRYKQEGGKYEDVSSEKPLKRWYNEKWSDIGNKEYPVYRPTIRVSKHTPLLQNEINPENLKKQIKLKQKIKGKKNLPAFIKK